MKLTSQQKDTLEAAILSLANAHEDMDYDYRLHMACRKFRVRYYPADKGCYYLFDQRFGRRVSLSLEAGGLQWVRGWETAVSDYGLAPATILI